MVRSQPLRIAEEDVHIHHRICCSQAILTQPTIYMLLNANCPRQIHV